MRAWVYHILSAEKYYLCVYVLINSVSYFFFSFVDKFPTLIKKERQKCSVEITILRPYQILVLQPCLHKHS